MLGFIRNIRKWWINRKKGWFQVRSLPKVVPWIQKARSSAWSGKQWNFFDNRLKREKNLRLRVWKRFAEQLAGSSGIDTQGDFRGACHVLRLQGRLARIPANVKWLERFVRRDPFWDANRQLLKASNGMTPDEAWQNFQSAYARNPIAALTLFTAVSPGPEPVWASYAEGANTTLALEHGNDPTILHDLLALDWPVRGSMLHLMYMLTKVPSPKVPTALDAKDHAMFVCSRFRDRIGRTSGRTVTYNNGAPELVHKWEPLKQGDFRLQELGTT